VTDGTSVWQIATIEVQGAAVVDTSGQIHRRSSGWRGAGWGSLRAIEDQAGEAASAVDSSSYSAGEDRPCLISDVLQRDELASDMQNW